jgi:membrane-associated HD superfamily phosphohydrolase
MVTRYQYVRAVAEAGGDASQVSEDDFRYPGPRPRSRETAILMLADASEARVRAEVPREEADLRRIIKSVIEGRMASDQLDKTDLTLHDLDQIYESFVATLRGMYHARIPYPTLAQAVTASEPTVPIPFPRLRPSESLQAPASSPEEGNP